MRVYTSEIPDTAVLSWEKIREALYDAATSYKRDQKIREKVGFFHGEKGVWRADNIITLTAKSDKIDEEKIFILLSAIFSSSSKSLINCIAEKLIPGKYERKCILGSGCYNRDTLTSTVFSNELIHDPIDSPDHYGLDTYYSEVSIDNDYNKSRAIKGIIKKLILDYVPTDKKVVFLNDVKLCLSQIEKKPCVVGSEEEMLVVISPN